MLRINCAQSWPYLKDYTGMQGQQNINLRFDALDMFIQNLS